MASLRGVCRAALGARPAPLAQPASRFLAIRCASTASSTPQAPASAEFSDLFEVVPDSTVGLPEPGRDVVKQYYPIRRVWKRKQKLPSSRYRYHPPKYNRGPLHPIQSPPSSDPIARDFVPGPFHLPRLQQTFQSTNASDIMTLAYLHKPPGTESHEPIGQRLRGWDGSSPYHKNRPLRGPRGGGSRLRVVERDITFRNIPEIKEITVSTFSKDAIKNMELLVIARAMMLSITGVLPEITAAKKNVTDWGLKKGVRCGVKATMRGQQAYDFLDRCVNLVFPKIKDWKGLQGTSGDMAGNLSWGFTGNDIQLFPEIEVNIGSYPLKQIPGCRVYVKTTATSDRQARLLLQSFGVPFHGKLSD